MPNSSTTSNGHGEDLHQGPGPQQLPPQPSAESHPYKNVPLSKASMNYYHHQHQLQQNNNHQGTVYAQRADVWSPVASVTTPPPPPTPDDELLSQLSLEELIARIRSLEAKNRKLLYDSGSMTKDINHHLSSLQQLKQQNYQLVAENNELKELCCFLEDERARCRAIAREWQSFGTHMSRVMRHEVTNYSNKLTQLEGKQFELVRENFELKQLCLLLDNALSSREAPEGSISSSIDNLNPNVTNANANVTSNGKSHPKQSHSLSQRGNALKDANNHYANENNGQQQRVILSQQILEYIRSLEDRIKQLETERRHPSSSETNCPTTHSGELYDNSSNSVTNTEFQHQPGIQPCPPPLFKAMQVLKIQEELNSNDSPATTDSNMNPSTNECNNEVITDQQKAIVKGLCNVIWRKIEDTS